MVRTQWRAVMLFAVLPSWSFSAEPDVAASLARPILAPRQTLIETENWLEANLPPLDPVKSVAAWEATARQLREAMLRRVVLRGAAADWAQRPANVEWLETVPGGPGYHLRKLRYEAVPGLWIPAILYEPDQLTGKVPVVLNVNGHDGNGKAARYKQIRCINLAKRGILALNLEWLGMGQLRSAGYAHGRMNQLDLCGTSGLAPFFLCMQRGLDILLSLPSADPTRVAVTGLSGGGWQTIYISSLDPRVTLTNPVAGYSGFRTRIRHHKDLGDSEQTPCDMATVGDYTHLTALMAPRATLLTYNSKDDCCFESGYALQPLLDAARPVFKLYGQESRLRAHVNDVPGTHNYEQDNRQAFYRMVGDHFFAGKSFDPKEIACESEVKSAEQLLVPLPHNNADFNTLARALSKPLPRAAALPTDRPAAAAWQLQLRQRLAALLHAPDYNAKEFVVATEMKDGLTTTLLRIRLGGTWTVPAVELVMGAPKATALVLSDGGRRGTAAEVQRLMQAGYRVVALDPFYFGECSVAERDSLFALLVSAIGQRPLGLQASQVAALARWTRARQPQKPVLVVAVGPRSSLIAMAAAALDLHSIDRVELHGASGSLKEVIERNQSFEQLPEFFCFGLLEALDINQLVALIAPRPIRFVAPDMRVKTELAGLANWYKTLGAEFDPLR